MVAAAVAAAATAVVAAAVVAAAATQVEVLAEVWHMDKLEAVSSVIACNIRHFDTEESGAKELRI